MPPTEAQQLTRGQNKRAFLYRQLSGILRTRITAGQYRPGERIPSMDELAASFRLNKATVRGAVAELASEGLIYTVPAQGTFVAEPSSPNPTPRRTTLTIGVVSTVMVPNQTGPYHLELLEAIRRELHDFDANMLVIPSALIEPQIQIVDRIAASGLHGVICIGPFQKNTLDAIVHLKLPAILLDFTPAHPSLPLDVIAIDNRQGGALAIDHLLSLRHTRFAIIAGAPGQPATQERLAGALDRLKQANLPTQIPIEYGNFLTEGGRIAMESLLRRNPRPTAVFCMSDEMAAGALQAIRQHRDLHVPEDISLVGFDDTTLATRVYPQLTTIQTPKSQMASRAIRQMREQIEDPTHIPSTTTIATRLITRESTAPTKPI